MMGYSGCGGSTWGQGYGFFGTWGTVSWIISLVFLLLIVVGSVLLVWWLVRQFSHPVSSEVYSSKSIELINERYAKGEINKEQYEQMKKDLGG